MRSFGITDPDTVKGRQPEQVLLLIESVPDDGVTPMGLSNKQFDQLILAHLLGDRDTVAELVAIARENLSEGGGSFDEVDDWRAITLAMLVICWRAGAFRWQPVPRDYRFMSQRMVAEVFTTFCFLTALANMPIAAATAAQESAPMPEDFYRIKRLPPYVFNIIGELNRPPGRPVKTSSTSTATMATATAPKRSPASLKRITTGSSSIFMPVRGENRPPVWKRTSSGVTVTWFSIT